MAQQLSTSAPPCAATAAPFGSISPSATQQMEESEPAAGRAASPEAQQVTSPGSSLHPLSFSQAAPAAASFVRGISASGPFASLAAHGDSSNSYISNEALQPFQSQSVAADMQTETIEGFTGISEGTSLGLSRSVPAGLGPVRAAAPDAGAATAAAASTLLKPVNVSACDLALDGADALQAGTLRSGKIAAGISSCSPARIGGTSTMENSSSEATAAAAGAPAAGGLAAGSNAYRRTQNEAGMPSGGDYALPNQEGSSFEASPRSGIEKYLQWLDAIHTACSKLDDLCSKLDRHFPNATREWEATSAGIRGARQLFHIYGESLQHHCASASPILRGASASNDDCLAHTQRKRQRRDPAAALNAGAPGGMQQLSQHATPRGLPQEYGTSSGLSLTGRNGQQLQQPSPTGALTGIGLGGGAGGPYASPAMSSLVKQTGGNEGGSSSLAVLPLAQQCMAQLPGPTSALSPAGVASGGAPVADGGEYEYLLDFPEQEAPDPENPSDLKCDVAGVYWDKRSWIASWYEGGKRYYKSFSAKTHGFYRSKYWAIKVRLSKVQTHALAGKGCKARAAAA